MNKAEEKIYEEYALNYRIEAESYRMMGKMLNDDFINERLKLYGISDMYIYGGTFLATQLSRAIGGNANIKGIVDKYGHLAMKTEVPIISFDALKRVYKSEKIIITAPRYYGEIKSDLLQFISADNILLLGEFLEGFF